MKTNRLFILPHDLILFSTLVFKVILLSLYSNNVFFVVQLYKCHHLSIFAGKAFDKQLGLAALLHLRNQGRDGLWKQGFWNMY